MAGSMMSPQGFLAMDRYNDSSNPSQYSPQNYYDPMAAYQASMMQAQQLFAMQHPAMAGSQAFGRQIGQVLTNALNGGGQQQPQAQAPQGPQTDAGQALEQLRQKYSSQGYSAPKALYQASQDMMNDPKYSNDQQAQQVADHALKYAINTLKYDPELQNKNDIEHSHDAPINMVGPDGAKVAVPKGPASDALAKAGFTVADATPQIATGTLHEIKRNGLFVTEKWDGQKWQQVSTSRAPLQETAAFTGDDAKAVAAADGDNAVGKVMSTAGSDKITEGLQNQALVSKQAVDSIDALYSKIQPGTIGKPADINAMVNNSRATVSTIGKQLGLDTGAIWDSAAKNVNLDQNAKDQWRAMGIGAEQVKALTISAALKLAAAQAGDQKDGVDRKFLFEQNLERLGAETSDPLAFKATLQQMRQELIRDAKTAFDTKGKSVGVRQPDWLQKEQLPTLPNAGQDNPTQQAPQAAPGAPAQAAPVHAVEGAKTKSKSGRPMTFSNGHWQYD